ncbi:Bug family tripartite tricarboxylate transporter substrate binding protein [Aquabacter spiritensis]|uniref:Tripartite-type tricarboxylate transporter receptor subunit TctC n=1 Tax=Aquabacter spiritensis TaxID=933073 RepID=A0A4R3LZC8_9HYPH|nr:tripartite tricarboxylate transporter substrate binding protein [Aquabacter spiritensis]TCT06104.1 tripartite-type tricarboxylate transporter receptor subunit TctC [Aquabacter spiritensis]
MRRISRNLKLFALAALGFACAPAAAADFPTRPITVIVPYAPGGPSDIAMRTIADRMSQALGQSLVTENVPGAGGMIGAAKLARSAPDGYTMMIHQNGLVIAPALYPKQSIDVEKELTAVGLVNTSYSFLVGSTKVPAKTLPELIAWMKGPAQPVKFAHPGIGTLAHLQAIIFAKDIGAEVTLIGYKGGGQAMSDIVGGHADLVWAAPTTSAELILAKKIQGYGFGAPQRYPRLPEIPTMGQSGYPNLDIPFWQALFVPAGTPKPIIDKLNAALRETLADEKIQKAYVERGVQAFPPDQLSPEAANAFVAAEAKKWGAVVREANIQPEAN